MSAPERIWANEGLEWHSFDCSDVKAGWTHPYILATPAALAASPEVAKLVAEAEARAEKAHEKEIAVWAENYAALERRMVEAEAQGMERALETMKTAGDSAVTEAMGQRLCCNGQDCGCHGATVEQYLEHLIRAEAAAIRREATK